MSEDALLIAAPLLEWLPYQSRIVAFLKRHDREVWNWFASSRQRAVHAEELRFDLLKSTYRVDRVSQAELYATADEVARKLGLDAPITIYQAHDPLGLNASLAYFPGEIHLVLHGPIAAQLAPLELRGLLGHEFTHYLLWQMQDGELLVASELLSALIHDKRSHPAHFASWRLLTLYNEILCDRGALAVTGDLHAAVSMLVKVQTGVQDIDAASYLRQADEIFARGPAKTEGITHPEAFIRARAIQLWADKNPAADDLIAATIDAGAELQQLDLLAQEKAAAWTRRMVDLLLARKWFQSDLVLAHARLYFDEYSPPRDELSDAELGDEIPVAVKSIRDYCCFVLLDFVAADRELDEPALAAALQVAEQLQIKECFMELARQELRLRKNQVEKADDKKQEILRNADKSAAVTS